MAFRVYNFTFQRLKKRCLIQPEPNGVVVGDESGIGIFSDSSYVQKEATTPNIVGPRM